MYCGKILFWPWDRLNELTEEESTKKGWTIGLYDTVLTEKGWQKVSLMIFIKKINYTEYQVIVIKSDKKDKFLRLPQDNFTKYVEDDEYISFYFYCFYGAHKFADKILPLHKEFSDRPIGIIP